MKHVKRNIFLCMRTFFQCFDRYQNLGAICCLIIFLLFGLTVAIDETLARSAGVMTFFWIVFILFITGCSKFAEKFFSKKIILLEENKIVNIKDNPELFKAAYHWCTVDENVLRKLDVVAHYLRAGGYTFNDISVDFEDIHQKFLVVEDLENSQEYWQKWCFEYEDLLPEECLKKLI